MKTEIKIITIGLLLLTMIGSIFAFVGNGHGKNQGGMTYEIYDDTQVNHQMEIDKYPFQELNQDEIDALTFMREEEKLARDVYLELYDIWDLQIFSNIARSESTHTNAVKSLLDKYGIDDPMKEDKRGEFTNPELQKLYDDLVKQGSNSLLDALKVGATIEDLDIKDLEEKLLITDNEDIKAVFNNLQKGSRNHLRSFTKLIKRNGGNYEPQYITKDYYEKIINSDMERGIQYNSDGSFNQINSENKNMIGENQANNQKNPKSVYETSESNQSENFFIRLWRGFLNWFN